MTLRVRSVDEKGILLWATGNEPLDVLFDGQRVWSFWTGRDADIPVVPWRRFRWPKPLRRYLDGTTKVTVRTHVTGRVLSESELRFGSGDRRISVVNAAGAPLGMDKSGKMTATFEGRSQRDMRPLLDAMSVVLDALERAGVEPFLAYGTLLGAVREGDFLGHDSDADLGYVSRHEHPCDVMVESFRLQRLLRGEGLQIYRYSGAAFRVDLVEDDGTRRGLDVFGGFMDGGRLYLMGEVGEDFRPEWVRPRSTVTLSGREFPAPARPEELLRASYGDSWRVPDPAFRFRTPQHTVDQLNGWFRGGSAFRRDWQRAFSRFRGQPPPKGASALAQLLHEEEPPETQVLDVGAGRGRDALWLSRQGRSVTAYDYVPGSLDGAASAAATGGASLDVRQLNLTDLRSVLGEGARLAHGPAPRAMLARHVADATNGFGRESLARFASMALRDGGRLYLEVWTGGGAPPPRLLAVDLTQMTRRLERHGGRVVRTEELEEREADVSPDRAVAVGRLVAQWA
jgi:SAM-dependent methyltransferase